MSTAGAPFLCSCTTEMVYTCLNRVARSAVALRSYVSAIVGCTCRLGTRHGAAELKAHPFFKGLDWEHLTSMKAPNIPEIEHELDTRNFENFEEDADAPSSTSGGKWKKRADPVFMNFTYKSFQAVGRDEGTALICFSYSRTGQGPCLFLH